MKHAPWLLSFFIGAPAVLVLTFLSLQHFQPVKAEAAPAILGATIQTPPVADSLFAPSLSPQFITSDARPLIIRNYLHYYKSPLEPYSRLIIETSDKYSLDYRLLVAIAQQESNLCKRVPPNSFNCWGYGIYGNLTTRFDNYPQAVETVAKGLKRDYYDQGLKTPEEIMAKYTPPSLEKGGPWAKGVSQFLTELQ